MFMSAAGFGLFSSYQTALLVAGPVLMCAPSQFAASDQQVADVTGRLNSR